MMNFSNCSPTGVLRDEIVSISNFACQQNRQGTRLLPTGDTPHGGAQLKKRPGLNLGCDLGANPCGTARLVYNHEPAGALDALDHRLDVPGEHGAQVDELDARAARRFGHERRELGRCVRQKRERGLAVVDGRAPREQGQVGAGHEDLCASERELKVVDRDLLDRGAVEDLGLHEDDRIWVAY